LIAIVRRPIIIIVRDGNNAPILVVRHDSRTGAAADPGQEQHCYPAISEFRHNLLPQAAHGPPPARAGRGYTKALQSGQRQFTPHEGFLSREGPLTKGRNFRLAEAYVTLVSKQVGKVGPQAVKTSKRSRTT